MICGRDRSKEIRSVSKEAPIDDARPVSGLTLACHRLKIGEDEI